MPPSPVKPDSHSASMAPTIAPGTEIRMEANRFGSADGTRTIQHRRSASLPPLTRTRSSDSGEADRSPSTMLTSAGKSTTIAPIVAIPSLPWPKISSSTGAMATSGTERSSIAIGMKANSNGLNDARTARRSPRHHQPGDEADRRRCRG